MYDMHIILKNSPGELAWLGKTLALNDIGIEGGGVFALGGESHAHFLVADGYKAKTVLESEGFRVYGVCRPLIRVLRQERLGELGAIAAALSEKGVNILTQYSDHANQLILITDNDIIAQQATEKWAVKV
ncbi:amino acid-binding protein [Hafnia paralvei]|uniref:amino acid-binding protein n=1 Tax=Hafnia paralvei TaxID=546367 RepID=UPI0038D0D9C6